MNIRFLPARVFYKLYRLSLPGSHPARDNVWFQPGERDVYLVSYPRSGNTWMRVILAELLYGTSGESIKDLQRYVPDAHVATRWIDVIPAEYHVVKSHSPLQLDEDHAGAYHRVIYLVRDPRDVVLSHYRYLATQRKYNHGFERFLVDWTRGRIWPCSWQEHVDSWAGDGIERSGYQICVARYEDLVADTLSQVVQICKSLGIPTTDESVQRAITAASVDRMKQKENQGMPDHETTDGLRFIGGATAHQWEGQLTAGQVERIRQSAEAGMKMYGYS